MTQPKKELSLVHDDEALDQEVIEQIEHLVNDGLHELREILDEIDMVVISIINSVNTIEMDTLPRLIRLFEKYASILHLYSFFNELSQAMNMFSLTMKENVLPTDEQSSKNVFMLLESFIYVLGRWDLRFLKASHKRVVWLSERSR